MKLSMRTRMQVLAGNVTPADSTRKLPRFAAEVERLTIESELDLLTTESLMYWGNKEGGIPKVLLIDTIRGAR